jgi:hypothetical protein
MRFQTHGTATLSEFLGDNVAYRNLVPADPRLPPVAELRAELGLDSGAIPRKAEPAYGTVVAELLRRGRQIECPGGSIERLLYVGDSAHNDGLAFANILAATGWPGWAFIGHDSPQETPEVKIEDELYLANRWSALPAFLGFLEYEGFAVDEQTAVVLDLDKTAIGARGRNDAVINAARVEGVQRTVSDLLGDGFDRAAFETAYSELNQSTYHPFTTDNQDYLAYICLMLGAGLFTLEGLVGEVQSGSLADFAAFISRVQARRDELARTGLAPIHDEVWACVQAGDPTPFKAFRYNEYLTTVARFGVRSNSSTDTPVDELLRRQIVLTQEVREAAATLRARGALLFGISDKPDEASLPNAQQAQAGMLPLHHLPTIAVSEA